MGDKIFNVLGSIIVLATISTLVINASGTSSVISAFGNAFSGSLKTAEGR